MSQCEAMRYGGTHVAGGRCPYCEIADLRQRLAAAEAERDAALIRMPWNERTTKQQRLVDELTALRAEHDAAARILRRPIGDQRDPWQEWRAAHAAVAALRAEREGQCAK